MKCFEFITHLICSIIRAEKRQISSGKPKLDFQTTTILWLASVSINFTT